MFVGVIGLILAGLFDSGAPTTRTAFGLVRRRTTGAEQFDVFDWRQGQSANYSLDGGDRRRYGLRRCSFTGRRANARGSLIPLGGLQRPNFSLSNLRIATIAFLRGWDDVAGDVYMVAVRVVADPSARLPAPTATVGGAGLRSPA